MGGSHRLIEYFGNMGPIFGTLLLNYLTSCLVLFSSPLELISTQFLDEQPPFEALTLISCWDEFGYVAPISLFEIFDVPFLL